MICWRDSRGVVCSDTNRGRATVQEGGKTTTGRWSQLLLQSHHEHGAGFFAAIMRTKRARCGLCSVPAGVATTKALPNKPPIS
jgi:hypothetical protein